MDNTLVIFYSRDGSTKVAANYLGNKFGIPVLELVEEKPSRNFILSGYRAVLGKRRKLAGDPWSQIKDVNTLFIGAPIWAGNGNPILNSFLDHAILKDKKVYIFTLQADPSISSSSKVLEHYKKLVKEKGGEVVGSIGLHGTSPGKISETTYIEKQLNKWNIKF